MINRDHDLPIKRQAELLGMSRGSVYYLPRPVSDADLALMRRIDALHLDHPFMGARMLRRMLRREGLTVGRRHVATLMQRMRIEALCPQPGTSKAHPGHKIYPYLLRKLAITRSNQVWALDTTYIPMARGFVYLTAVVDVASRKVLAHKVAITLEACHAKEVISEAFARYGTPEIVNTDQGSQFTATEFTEVVLAQGWPAVWHQVLRAGCKTPPSSAFSSGPHSARPDDEMQRQGQSNLCRRSRTTLAAVPGSRSASSKAANRPASSVAESLTEAAGSHDRSLMSAPLGRRTPSSTTLPSIAVPVATCMLA